MNRNETPFEAALTSAANFISTMAIQFGCMELVKLEFSDPEGSESPTFIGNDRATTERLIIINAQAMEDQLGVSS